MKGEKQSKVSSTQFVFMKVGVSSVTCKSLKIAQVKRNSQMQRAAKREDVAARRISVCVSVAKSKIENERTVQEICSFWDVQECGVENVRSMLA